MRSGLAVFMNGVIVGVDQPQGEHVTRSILGERLGGGAIAARRLPIFTAFLLIRLGFASQRPQSRAQHKLPEYAYGRIRKELQF
jgi:hypothetical protein